MAHFAKPFYKQSRQTWYAEIGRRQYALGPNPPGRPMPRKKNGVWQAPPEILNSFEDLKHRLRVGPATRPEANGCGITIVDVFDEFLEWCRKHRTPRTYAWYRAHLQSFVSHQEDGRRYKELAVADLRPIDVERWVDAHPTWGPSHQRGAKIAVQRAFTWAERMGVVTTSPVRHLPKPAAGRRERVIGPEEQAAIRSHFAGDAFQDLLDMAWHTGARPQECIRIEARHVDLANRRVVLPPAEAKGKKRFRVIYLNDPALALVRRLVSLQLAGPLFRNRDGNPWTAWSINNRFCRYQLRIGREELRKEGFAPDPGEVDALASQLAKKKSAGGPASAEIERAARREARKTLFGRAARQRGQKYCLYLYRHTFATRLLTAGVDSLTVSTLLGHVDGTMLAKVYSHLQANAGHLIDAVNAEKPGNGKNILPPDTNRVDRQPVPGD
jgi:integrase